MRYLALAIFAWITGAMAASAADFKVDAAHSSLDFKVKHLSISTVSGRFGSFDGALSLEPGKPETLSVRGTIDVASVDTRNEKRDEHLRAADFFDAENHPKMIFRSTAVEAGKDGAITLNGRLTIRGVSRDVVLKGELSEIVQDPWGNTKVGLSASGSINRKDFGMNFHKALEGGGLLVGDEVQISIAVEAAMGK